MQLVTSLVVCTINRTTNKPYLSFYFSATLTKTFWKSLNRATNFTEFYSDIAAANHSGSSSPWHIEGRLGVKPAVFVPRQASLALNVKWQKGGN